MQSIPGWPGALASLFDLSPGSGVGRDPSLAYNSGTVSVSPILEVNLGDLLPPDSPIPASIALTLTWADRPAQPPVVFPFFNQVVSLNYLVAVQVNAPVTDSGLYAWKLHTEVRYTSSNDPTSGYPT